MAKLAEKLAFWIIVLISDGIWLISSQLLWVIPDSSNVVRIWETQTNLFVFFPILIAFLFGALCTITFWSILLCIIIYTKLAFEWFIDNVFEPLTDWWYEKKEKGKKTKTKKS